MLRRVFASLLTLAVGFATLDTVAAATVSIVNLKTTDLGYSPVSGLVYASVPNASLSNPNTLMPINPNTTALGTPIPIGFDPARIAVSSDGNNVFTVIGGLRAVQRYNLPSAAADQLFSISGGPQISDLYGVPVRPNAVLLHEYAAGFSPPAIATVVYENAILLPHQVGHGLGVGGPDIIAVDPTNGTKAYGYQNTITSYDNVPMVIGALGIDTAGPSALQGVLTGFNVGRIAILGDRLFDSRGEIFSLSLGFQVGAFLGGDNFVLDPTLQRFFSITSSGSNKTIRSYSLDTLTLLGTETISPIPGSVGSLTRFGSNGLAFRTSNDQVVFVTSAVVPEPASFVLAAFGLIGLGALSWRKRGTAIDSAGRSKAMLGGSVMPAA